MAYQLMGSRRALIGELQQSLERAAKEIGFCSRCGNFTDAPQDQCSICRDPHRDTSILCIVEGAPDIQILEQAGVYGGAYFCLGGKMSPQQEETVTDDRLKALTERLKSGEIWEVVLALNTDTESEATAHMLFEFLSHFQVKTSRLAFGLPAGSGLAYSDPETLGRALRGRQTLDA